LLPAGLPAGAGTDLPAYAGGFIRELAGKLCDFAEVELLAPLPYWCSLRHPFRSLRQYRQLGILSRDREGLAERFAFWAARGELTRPPLAFMGWRRQSRALDELLDSGERPDLLHAFFLVPSGCATGLAASRRGIPYVITSYESYLPDFARWPHLRRVMGRALGGAARITCPSEFQRRRLLSLFPQVSEKTLVVHNGVDTARFTPRSQVSREGPARLTFVGNLVEVKDPRTTVEAARLLAGGGFDFRLLILGDGRLRECVHERARDLAECVCFRGAVGHQEVSRILREETDVLVLSSITDTFPHVVLEALASGVPVAATRCGGPEEMISDEVGRLVPVRDPGALADAVAEIWQKRESFPPERLTLHAREHFSYEVIAPQFTAICREVVDDAVR
jgi:glycosyltransferase involved in cell wall biosynthesis